MAMVVKNNMSAVNTLNTLNKNQSALGKSLQKVSSGMKINSAQDDASGYAISERMRVMIRSLDQANQNTQNGSSLMKVAEGAVSNTVEILKTLKEKAINAATDTNTDEDRAIIQKEIDQLVDQIDDNALVTFNGKYLLDGSKSAAGNATYNTWTNQALSEDTDALTKLTELKARDGEKLTIETSDKVTVSYVQNGKTYTTTAIIGEMKNATLGGVFQLAENIDAASKTFATAANEDIAKAGGVSAATSYQAVRDAISYLQQALSSKESTIAAVMDDADKFIKYTDGSDNIIGNIKQQVLDTAASVTDSTLVTDYTLSKASGISKTSNGVLYQKVENALSAYNDATKILGQYTGTAANDGGAANVLGGALKNLDPSITWNGELSGLDGLDLNALGVADEYKAYKTAYDNKQAAKTALDDAVKEYNEGLATLDALNKLNEYNSAKEDFAEVLESYMNSVEREITNATTNIDYALAANAGTNKVAITYNPTVQDDEASAKQAIDSIIKAVRDKLNGILSSSAIVGTGATSAVQTNTDALIKDEKEFGKTDQTAQSPAAALISESLADALSAAATAIDAANTSAIFDAKVKAAIDNAEISVLPQFNGPNLLIGTNVGVDPAGKVVSTLDGTTGITFMASGAGTDGQISGFTVSISDSDGNVRKSVNTVLNAWSTSVYGKNASEKDNSLAFQIGASANQTITVDMADMRAEAIGLKGKDGKVVDVSNKENANAAISVFENALQKALDVQTTIGAIEARLEYTASNLTTSTENVQAAESTIRDADMAKEMTNYTKNNVLLQAAQSMLAQANQNSSAVLSLLQ